MSLAAAVLRQHGGGLEQKQRTGLRRVRQSWLYNWLVKALITDLSRISKGRGADPEKHNFITAQTKLISLVRQGQDPICWAAAETLALLIVVTRIFLEKLRQRYSLRKIPANRAVEKPF